MRSFGLLVPHSFVAFAVMWIEFRMTLTTRFYRTNYQLGSLSLELFL